MNPVTSKSTVTLIVVGMIVTAVLVLSGVFALLFVGKSVPDALWPILGGSLAGLPALLASTRGVPAPSPPPAE